MNLWQKLVKIRTDIDVFVKNGKSYGYEYVTGSQVLHKIKSNMDELGVILSPRMGSHNTWIHEYKNNRGKDVKDFVIESEGSYVWINSEKPEEREEVPWKFFGQQDDVSKAYGSALTYSERYFLLKFFGVPTDEDDADAKGANKRNNNSYSNQNTNTSKPKRNASQGELSVEKLQSIVKGKKVAATKKFKVSFEEVDKKILEHVPEWHGFTDKPDKLKAAKELLESWGC